MYPTISIITPSLNQGDFIEETIRSVVSQEGDFFLDYIVVDGGSTDNSVEIIKKCENLLSDGDLSVHCRGIKYRWMSEGDNGQSDAINKGFRMAEGEILAWLNSDDTYFPNTLQRVADLFRPHPDLDVLYGKAYFTNERGEITGMYPTEPFDYQRLATFNFICQPSTFFRREAWNETGGLDTSLHYVMDYDLMIRMTKQFRVMYLTEFLSAYRLHEKSKTISRSIALMNHRECLKTVVRHFHWAPLNRVYGYCSQLIEQRMPPLLARLKFPIALLSIPLSFAMCIRLNRGIRLEDLKMINSKNISEFVREHMRYNRVLKL